MKAPLINSKPWYREPWPWFLMTGPAIVVVAGISTAIIAARTHDGLVVDDYYKQGLSVNKDLSRDFAAKAAGYKAGGVIDAGLERVVLTMQNTPANVKELRLTFARATAGGSDRRVLLQQSNQNTFIGTLAPSGALERGKWYVTLDDESRHWRLISSVVIHGTMPTTFTLGSEALKAADD